MLTKGLQRIVCYRKCEVVFWKLYFRIILPLPFIGMCHRPSHSFLLCCEWISISCFLQAARSQWTVNSRRW